MESDDFEKAIDDLANAVDWEAEIDEGAVMESAEDKQRLNLVERMFPTKTQGQILFALKERILEKHGEEATNFDQGPDIPPDHI